MGAPDREKQSKCLGGGTTGSLLKSVKSCCQTAVPEVISEQMLKDGKSTPPRPAKCSLQVPEADSPRSSHQDTVTAIARGQHPSPELLHTQHPTPRLTLGHGLHSAVGEVEGAQEDSASHRSLDATVTATRRPPGKRVLSGFPFHRSWSSHPAFYVLLTFLTDPSPILRLLSLGHQQEDIFKSAGLCIHSEPESGHRGDPGYELTLGLRAEESSHLRSQGHSTACSQLLFIQRGF